MFSSEEFVKRMCDFEFQKYKHFRDDAKNVEISTGAGQTID